MAKVIIEMAHPSEYILEVFKHAIENKIKTINFAEDELEYICEQIKGYHEGYEQGKKDRDKEIAEHSVFYSSKPIEDIVLEARADERAKVLEEVLFAFNNEWTLESLACHESKYEILAIIKRQIEQLKEQE